MPNPIQKQNKVCPHCQSVNRLLTDYREGTVTCVACGLVVKRGICDASAPPMYKDANGATKNTGNSQTLDFNLAKQGGGVRIPSTKSFGNKQLDLQVYRDKLILS